MKNIQRNLERKRAAWLAKHAFTPGKSFQETLRLNEEFVRRFPMTREEMEQRAKQMVGVEFVL
jgi:hypothetical protein